jgi:predicted MPP superfamily phosphohydrolase
MYSSKPSAQEILGNCDWPSISSKSKPEPRLGTLHARQRLGIEKDHEAQIFGQGINFFHLENWYSVHSLIRIGLKLIGLYQRGRRNAARIQVRHNHVRSRKLPRSFNGFTLLHLSDLHVDMNEAAMRRLAELIPNLQYDICVITGDFRGATFGPFDVTLDGLKRLRSVFRGPVYAVLGNHDTILMVAPLEEMGMRVLLNECEPIRRSADTMHLAGIDDAHFYRVDNIEKAAANIPRRDFSILLSHTPEIYRQAAHAGFDLLLIGHTHGGKFACPARSPSHSLRFFPGTWARGPGPITRWQATPPLVPAHRSCPCVSTARRRLRYIIWNAASILTNSAIPPKSSKSVDYAMLRRTGQRMLGRCGRARQSRVQFGE